MDIFEENCDTENNCTVSYFWKGLALFLLGVIIGLFVSPIKKGVTIGCNNKIDKGGCNDHFDPDEYYDDYNFETKIDSYQDIEFNNHKFSIDIIKGFEEEISSLQKKIEANVLVEFNFEDNLTKYETKLIIDQFRNLVQILTGMNIGVNKILVNQNSNWILSNLYLPSIEERSKNFSQTSYSRLRDKFSIILQKWFSNNRIQILSANFLHENKGAFFYAEQ